MSKPCEYFHIDVVLNIFVSRPGLHALALVVSKLSAGATKADHVPYRDSKLTRLLRPALGGKARVALVCAASLRGIDALKADLALANETNAAARESGSSLAPEAPAEDHLSREDDAERLAAAAAAAAATEDERATPAAPSTTSSGSS
ncbi:hypothetical protein JL721_8795 [Aureococcus anophagefferens]|nr:hypothetical protein JL721_8795 [Aureococcus anophagefferens]